MQNIEGQLYAFRLKPKATRRAWPVHKDPLPSGAAIGRATGGMSLDCLELEHPRLDQAFPP